MKLTIFNPVQTNKPLAIFDNLDISASSREEYKQRIKYLLSFIDKNPIDDDTILVKFKRELENNISLGVSARNKYLSTARVYLKELYRKGDIKIEPVDVKSFKQSKKHKVFGHTEDEIKKIIKALQLYNPRDKAILYLMIFQGLRQVEIVRLDIEDINITAKVIQIRGKGRDDKENVNLHPDTLEVLKVYLASIGNKSGKLFGVTERTIRNIHTRVIKRLGIQRTTHGFRHFYTTTLVKSFGGDLLTVQQFTRHRNLEMLQIYNDDIEMEKKLPVYEDAFNKLK